MTDTLLCEKCRHIKLDSRQKGRGQVVYARCGHPKAQDGKISNFCSTQRLHYGLCAGGKLYEPLHSEIPA